MHEKDSIMVVRYGLKILSLEITVWHHSESLVISNSYPCDGMFSPHLTSIKDSYNILPYSLLQIRVLFVSLCTESVFILFLSSYYIREIKTLSLSNLQLIFNFLYSNSVPKIVFPHSWKKKRKKKKTIYEIMWKMLKENSPKVLPLLAV